MALWAVVRGTEPLAQPVHWLRSPCAHPQRDSARTIRVVGSWREAFEHVNHYGSHHTDSIVTTNLDAAREFARDVDSSAVMINASTRFNDGGEFGLGAEIGISTDKLHARGPCGLKELTSYKYVVYGNGQMR